MNNNIISTYIDGFERYIIDIKGNIFDTKRNAMVCQWIDNVGYKQCILKNSENKRYYKRIHRLVAISFIPNEYDLPQVNHKDGNKLNNTIDNLEWCTNSKNTQHGYDNQLYHSKHRSHAVRAISKDGLFSKEYKSIRSMCEELHMNRKTVTMILKEEKLTNNYNYLFEYIEESQETIESIA